MGPWELSRIDLWVLILVGMIEIAPWVLLWPRLVVWTRFAKVGSLEMTVASFCSTLRLRFSYVPPALLLSFFLRDISDLRISAYTFRRSIASSSLWSFSYFQKCSLTYALWIYTGFSIYLDLTNASFVFLAALTFKYGLPSFDIKHRKRSSSLWALFLSKMSVGMSNLFSSSFMLSILSAGVVNYFMSN